MRASFLNEDGRLGAGGVDSEVEEEEGMEDGGDESKSTRVESGESQEICLVLGERKSSSSSSSSMGRWKNVVAGGGVLGRRVNMECGVHT